MRLKAPLVNQETINITNLECHYERFEPLLDKYPSTSAGLNIAPDISTKNLEPVGKVSSNHGVYYIHGESETLLSTN